MTACWCGVTAPAADRADGLAVTTLLNTYLREAGAPVVTGDLIALPRLRLTLFARARYRSATGRHAWTLPVRLAVHPGRSHADGCPAGAGPPMDAPGLAALIAVELAGTAAAVDVGRLVGAVAESSRYVAAFLDPHAPAGEPTRYLAAEQSLATGHPLHPTPKSRAPMTAAETLRYAPERHAAFPLHWFAADRDLVAEDSGLDQPASALLAGLLATDLADPTGPSGLAGSFGLSGSSGPAGSGLAGSSGPAGSGLAGSSGPAGRSELPGPAVSRTGPAGPPDPAGPALPPELADLAGLAELVARAGGRALLPAHPWQASRLVARPEVRALLARGRLVDLGPAGAPWHPTSSVRTLYRPDVGLQLKFTLEARITNSVRRNLRKELARGLEVHRLLAAGLGADIAAHHPDFGIVRDPAWVTLETGGPAESGFEVVLRENPYPADHDADVSVVAALCADAADGGPPRVARLVRRLARAAGHGPEPVAREWFARYLRVCADPLLWLYAEWGVALEAHQQNTLLELAGGWPAALRYRDNQGYYFAETGADRLRGLLPSLNEASDTICPDAIAEERLGYYLIQNNLLGVIGALGLGGVADERVLLADLSAHLAATAGCLPLVRRLLTAPTLRGKGNLRTRLADLDELVGPLATQSVYVTTPNPLSGNPPAGWPTPAPGRPA